jgi:hypothetical protein
VKVRVRNVPEWYGNGEYGRKLLVWQYREVACVLRNLEKGRK